MLQVSNLYELCPANESTLSLELSLPSKTERFFRINRLTPIISCVNCHRWHSLGWKNEDSIQKMNNKVWQSYRYLLFCKFTVIFWKPTKFNYLRFILEQLSSRISPGCLFSSLSKLNCRLLFPKLLKSKSLKLKFSYL